jgi:hypothetical protein
MDKEDVEFKELSLSLSLSLSRSLSLSLSLSIYIYIYIYINYNKDRPPPTQHEQLLMPYLIALYYMIIFMLLSILYDSTSVTIDRWVHQFWQRFIESAE